MKLLFWPVVLSIEILFVTRPITSLCPPQDDTSFCLCTESTDTCFYSCTASFGASLVSMGEYFNPCPRIKLSLTGEANFLPHGFFTKFGDMRSFEFTFSGLKLDSLTDPSPGPSVFQDTSVSDQWSLNFNWVETKNNWNWLDFSALEVGNTATTSFYSNISKIDNMNSDFYSAFENANLDSIVIGLAGLKSLADVPTGKYSTLVNMNFEKNEIQEIKRSHFPRPATNLKSISLSWNKIRVLPENLFTEMPELKYIDISANPISVLPEMTFKPIISSLNRLYVINLALSCDCQLAWILPYWETKVIDSGGMAWRPRRCKEPTHLANKSVGELTVDNLNCADRVEA
ncbi:uncharacterized protein LOC111088494 [Limulus polyphemus]|uniref:Uncharacterized protein LOC111088494 n=1 Tax=Limulus polyphemus TaxID=6850 RepID=A0ABM1TF44_LIMPO|nr:uncharacterized protein LOC111088494 [Limulus polyphemus]